VPVVTLISPITGDTFTAGDAVLLQASATIAAGSIMRLSFSVDGMVVGTITSSPSAAVMTWMAPAGEPGTTATYGVRAVAVSGQGFAGASALATITVVTP
jgi:chitinase